MSHDLTPRQAAILAFVCREIADKGRPPTAREICAEFGFGSTKAAADHLWALEAKGRIMRARNVARGIRVIAPGAPARVAVEQAVAVRGCDGRGGAMPAVFMPVTRAGEERAA